MQRADLDHHLEGLAEKEVAHQHARLVAPEHAGGQLAAAHLAAVHDVVVQQRRRVHELDRRRRASHGPRRDSRTARPSPASASGRSRLPPELMRWLAISGISATSEPTRARMSWLTRSMPDAVSRTRGSMLGVADFAPSNGITRPTSKPSRPRTAESAAVQWAQTATGSVFLQLSRLPHAPGRRKVAREAP